VGSWGSCCHFFGQARMNCLWIHASVRSRWHDNIFCLRPAGWSICRDWISAFGMDGRLIFGDLAAGVCLEIGGRKNVVNLFHNP